MLRSLLNLITNKLEIDVMQGTELQEAVELAVTAQMPAIVVHPELAQEANVYRGIRQGRFRIITAVDWPKGDRYAMDKLRDLPVDALSRDGFEILISERKHPSEIKAELLTCFDFIRSHLPEVIEIRIVLGAFMRDNEFVARVCDVLKNVPAPDMIRTDHHLRVQQSVANAQAHNDLITLIRKYTRRPIKIGGNINSAKALTSCEAARFAVSLKQANSIVKEVKENPDKIRKLLAKDDAKDDATEPSPS